jgi:hypothetical protein
MNKEIKRHKEGKVSFLKGGDSEPFLLLHGIPGSRLKITNTLATLCLRSSPPMLHTISLTSSEIRRDKVIKP